MNIQKEAKNRNTGKYDHAKKENKNNQESYSANLVNPDDKVSMLKNSSNAIGCSQEIAGEDPKVNINQSVLKKVTTASVFKTDGDTTDDAKKKCNNNENANEEVHYKGSTGAAEGTPVRTTTEGVAHDNGKRDMCSHSNVAKGGDNYQHGHIACGSTNDDKGGKTQSGAIGACKDQGDSSQSNDRELEGGKNVETLDKVSPKSEVKKKHYSNLLPNRNCNDDDKCNSSQNVKEVPPSQEEKEKSETSPPAGDRKGVNKDPPANDEGGSPSKGGNGDNKPVDTSVEAPPFNTPQKGTNNDAEEVQHAKMEGPISTKQNSEKAESSKKGNATLEEETKPSEPINSTNIRQGKNANMNKNKGVVNNDLDVITEEGGKTERGQKDNHPNGYLNSSANRTASGSSKKVSPFKRSEHQKDKENSNEETSTNNVMSQKNGNYKKFPSLNSAKNGASFKKEARRNNPNNGSSNRKSENYKTFGHSKRDECWKSCRDKNEDHNAASGDYVRGGESYKNEESHPPGGNSPNNSHGRNGEPHRANERGFKNGNPHTYRNAVNGGHKNVGATAQTGNSAKMNDNCHNADSYKMGNQKNYHRSGNNEDATGSHDQGVCWMNQQEQREQQEQSGKGESFNFRRNQLKNKKEATGVKQKDTRFHMAEKHAKKFDANYFARSDSANVGNDSGSASKKKVNSFSKQMQSTNYSKHSPVSGDKNGKETNGYDENDSMGAFTEGDISRKSSELVNKQVIHTANFTSPSGTYHNSGEKTHEHMTRSGKKNSTTMGSPSHRGHIDKANKTYAKLTHTNDGQDNPKESITPGGNSDQMRSENKGGFIPKADISDSGRGKIGSSGEKDAMKEIRRKEHKKGDYPTVEGGGSGAHVKKIERRAKHFTAHPGDAAKSYVRTNGDEYHHAGANGDEKDHTSSPPGEKDKNLKNGGKQNLLSGPENKRKVFSPKTDQRSSNADEVTHPFNFKEFECWMSGRYNKLLETYIDQENRKKNNSEMFEEEIKVYELCSAYTNSGVQKDTHEDLSQMTETLGSRGTTEEDAARSKDNTDVQTNPEMANERELVIEGRGGFSTRGNKGEHVDNGAGDSYNTAKGNYFPGSKNHMHVLNSSAAHQGENRYYQRNNNYRPNHQKRSLQLFHKNGPQNSPHNDKAPFMSFSSGKKWDNSGRAGGEEVVESAIEGAKLEGNANTNTGMHADINDDMNADMHADSNADTNTEANGTPSVKKYSAHSKNSQGEEKASDGNFSRKTYYEKKPAGKRFGNSNITTKKLSSNNGFYKKKYHAGDQKNDYMRTEMNNATFYKSSRQPMGQHNSKRSNWSAKLVNDRFGNRYEEPFGEPFGERLNERFSKQNNSNDMDHTSGMFYAAKNRMDNHVLLRNEMGAANTHTSNPAGNSKKSNATYLTAKSEGAKNRHYE
ncbi:hypothetical protein PVMG_03755 [Plasmodium vivax Mauritania I]|uniref:Uncharacterized protein n=1 Tax=Plasmodium vivax Mauritania I TaxID=1035515 RepID=A0A0J9TA87_PLAVI|nr:hypothetical protein PVMG_03755 [Plasmodium vivax Mauritania I]